MLVRGAGIGGFSCVVKAAYIANANGVSVVTFAVGPRHGRVSPGVNRAVKVNYVMITDAAETAVSVPAVNLIDSDFTTGLCGGAVNDDLIYVSHSGDKVTTKSERFSVKYYLCQLFF